MKQINLLGTLDKYLESYSGRERKSHYPSQASIETFEGIIGKCLRAQWYSWKGMPKTNPIPVSNIWKMRIGDSIHAEIARWLRELEYQVQEEYPFKFEHPDLRHSISGRIDDVIVFPKVNEFYGVECKTSWSKFFTNTKDGVAKKGPRPADLLQVLIYLSCVKDLRGCYMLYVARDNGQRYQFYAKLYDGKIGKQIKVGNRVVEGLTFDGVISRWKTLENLIKTDNRPPADYEFFYTPEKQQQLYDEYLNETQAKKPLTLKAWSRTHTEDWRCAYCEYWDRCKEE